MTVSEKEILFEMIERLQKDEIHLTSIKKYLTKFFLKFETSLTKEQPEYDTLFEYLDLTMGRRMRLLSKVVLEHCDIKSTNDIINGKFIINLQKYLNSK